MTVISTSFPNLPKDCYQEWWFLSEAHFETESALEEGGEEILTWENVFHYCGVWKCSQADLFKTRLYNSAHLMEMAVRRWHALWRCDHEHQPPQELR